MDAIDFKNDELITQLEKLAKDKRLERVFSESDSKPCALQLWLLELEKEKNKEYRILYGWIVPTTYKSKYWKTPGSGKLERVENNELTYKYRICRINLYRSGRNILDIIKKMCEGSSLNNACEELRIKKPKNNFGEIILGDSKEEIDRLYTIRPTIFLETEQSIEYFSQFFKPNKSPSAVTPAFAASLFLMDKTKLWRKNNSDYLPQINRLIKKSLIILKEETGLDFCGFDSNRIGNLEWIISTATDENENEKVLIRFILGPLVKRDGITASIKGIHILIKKDILKNKTEILVRCRARNSGEITYDQCIEALINEEDYEYDFQTGQEIQNVIVTIWTRENKNEPWEIWYENSYSPIRTIKFSSECQYKDGLSNNSVKFIIGDTKENTLMKVSSKIRKDISTLFPKPSKGGFFPVAYTKKGPNFSDWFISISKQSRIKKIIIIDPYFDKRGIDLISKSKRRNIEYIVLTCTQHRNQKNTEQRLKSSCKQMLIDNYVPRFILLNLTSKSNSHKQLFHDRYIITYVENYVVDEGFHLSNSIQGASKKSPMLVTSIDSYLLESVLEYINSLITAKTNVVKNAEIKKIFDTREIKKENKKEIEFFDYPLIGLFFSILLNKKYISSLSKIELKKDLRRLGLISEKDRPINLIRCRLYFHLFAEHLFKCDQDEFNKLWSCFGKWLSYVNKYEEYINKIYKYGDIDISNKIRNYLIQSISIKPPVGLVNSKSDVEEIGIFHYLSMDFNIALRRAEDMFMFNIYSFPFGNLNIRYAIKTLIKINSSSLISLIEELVTLSLESEKDYKSIGISILTAMSISEIVNEYHLNNIKFLPELLGSKIPFLRAIGVQIIIKSSFKKGENKKISYYFDVIQKLDKLEEIKCLCEWVRNLDTSNSTYDQDTIETLDNIRASVLDNIKNNWPENIKIDELYAIIRQLTGESGRVRSWYTIENILLPFVDQGKLEFNSISDFWLNSMKNILSSEVKFYPPDDQEFINVCGWFLANTSQEYHEVWFGCFKKICNIAFRKLYHPSAQSRDFSAWYNSIAILLWLKILFNIIVFYGKNNHKLSNSEIEDIETILSSIDSQLKRYDEYRLKECMVFDDLLKFSSYVEETKEKQKLDG